MKTRCRWADGDELMKKYHDKEWGVPVHDDAKLFEFLILEGAQAGLSWLTVLRKRENYRRAFDGFDAEKIALYKEERVARLMQNEGIIRNRLKIEAAMRSYDYYEFQTQQQRDQLNRLVRLNEVESMRLQHAMERLAKMSTMIASLMKRINETGDALVVSQ